MPTYEYECSQCGQMFEASQRINDPPLTKCLKCGAKGKVSRLISPGAGLIFKGSGFYITDYKKSAALPATGSSEKKSDGEKTSEKQAGKEKGAGTDKASPPASSKKL